MVPALRVNAPRRKRAAIQSCVVAFVPRPLEHMGHTLGNTQASPSEPRVMGALVFGTFRRRQKIRLLRLPGDTLGTTYSPRSFDRTRNSFWVAQAAGSRHPPNTYQRIRQQIRFGCLWRASRVHSSVRTSDAKFFEPSWKHGDLSSDNSPILGTVRKRY